MRRSSMGAGPSIEPQDRSADTETGHRSSEAGRLARLQTHLCEQLAKRHQIRAGKETLRGWTIEAGLWKPGGRRIEQVHCWRPRRSAFGERVQWDTSEHDWLEGRGPMRYLVRLIDDATSWSWGRFVERDATPFNMAVLWDT